MKLPDLCFVILGAIAGIIACKIYLWHIRYTLQKKTILWRWCWVRLACLALFFCALFYMHAGMGIVALLTFIITRNIILFKESRGIHGKL